MASLMNYSWPGNVRELENVVERAVIASRGLTLPFKDILEPTTFHAVGSASEKTLAKVERDHMIRVLEECYWRIEGQNGAAKILGINPNTLRGRMRKLGIRRPKKRSRNHHI